MAATDYFKIILGSFVFFAGLFPRPVSAAQSYRVNIGATVDITEFGVCRRITNSSGNDKFIPTNTATEWSNFYGSGTPGVSIAGCPPACGGVLVGGHCWYLGAGGDSCATTCASRGGASAATISYVGTGGTNAQCNSVLQALGTATSSTSDITPCNSGFGCVFSTGAIMRYRCLDVATNLTAAFSGFRRACACNN